MAETVDKVTARHRKEIKALDGALRAELKKAKQTTAGKGKKAKEILQAYVNIDSDSDIGLDWIGLDWILFHLFIFN
jgi:hypothetical protein